MNKTRAKASAGRLRVAIASDLHAYDGDMGDDAPSHCCVSETDPRRNSLVGLGDLIKKDQLTADLLVCPGDLGDKASPLAIQHVWRELQTLKKSLKAKKLYVATGNHDIDSRYAYNGYDAKGLLQTLTPAYPLAQETKADRYWSRHFVIDATADYRVLVLNSSAFHGEGRIKETGVYEYEHGRVSDHTISMIREDLKKTGKRPVNILLCHHHPHPHADLDLGENDLMKGGSALLALLASDNHGDWLVIHGHKHHPKLSYAAGGASSPIIFAAGSTCATLSKDLQTAAKNQFYIVDLPYGESDSSGFVGTFRAWDWLSEQGWRLASPSAQLPPAGGFGCRTSLNTLADRVAIGISGPSIKWVDLANQIPELQHLIPQDLQKLVRLLVDDKGIVAEPPNQLPPILIGSSK